MCLKTKIDTDGYAIVKNLLPVETINKLRQDVIDSQNHKGDLLSNPSASWILHDTRVLDTFRDAIYGNHTCGNRVISYFGDGMVSVDREGAGFHKDSQYRNDPNADEWSDYDYNIIRMGIYLQDHTSNSGCLVIREKSHLTHKCDEGKIINMRTGIGDVVLWKLTTTHSANGTVYRGFPSLSINPRINKWVPSIFKTPIPKPRAVVFITMSISNHYLYDYMGYLKTRKYAINRWLNSHWDDDKIKIMNNNMVLVHKPPVSHDDVLSATTDYIGG